MNIFKQFGIREVADVTLYSIHQKKDGSGDLYYVPALYLDTLKISGTDKSAESVWAEGGLGNGRLICWDFGKKIDVNLEDALCTPASMSLCWGGILSADWKDAEVDIESSISINRPEFRSIRRIEKCICPQINLNHTTIAEMLPRQELIESLDIRGSGVVRGKVYSWKLDISCTAKSVATIPDKFFDITGRAYQIDQSRPVTINNLPTYTNLKDAVVYRIKQMNMPANDIAAMRIGESLIGDNNVAKTSELPRDILGSIYNIVERLDTCAADYLAIIVDNDNKYHALVGRREDSKIFWAWPQQEILVSQFEGIDMWLRFQHLNTLLYFLLTKYHDDITAIPNEKLWCYFDRETMKPYADDYWFDQGDIYINMNLTFAPQEKNFKGKKITVTAEQWPGMYMMVGETFIRERGTDKDEHMQIKFPLCKVKSDHNLTLEADGDPVIMNIQLEVARPRNGIMMELTSYETAPKLLEEDGRFYEVDGSADVLSE